MKIENNILCIIEAGRTDGCNFYLQGTLSRPDYKKVNEVLEAVGGKWNKKAKAHVFEIDAAEAVDQVLTSGEVETVKNIRDQFQFFPTPKSVVDMMIDAAGITGGCVVFEPSAGTGEIARGFSAINPYVSVVTCEIQERNAAVLRDLGYKPFVQDFLTMEPEAIYDVVAMNPPFANSADVKHVNHAMKFLKPGGKLVAIMASSVTFRGTRLHVEFREKIAAMGGTITALPEKSFKDSGTMVNTVLVEVTAP